MKRLLLFCFLSCLLVGCESLRQEESDYNEGAAILDKGMGASETPPNLLDSYEEIDENTAAEEERHEDLVDSDLIIESEEMGASLGGKTKETRVLQLTRGGSVFNITVNPDSEISHFEDSDGNEVATVGTSFKAMYKGYLWSVLLKDSKKTDWDYEVGCLGGNAVVTDTTAYASKDTSFIFLIEGSDGSVLEISTMNDTVQEIGVDIVVAGILDSCKEQ